MPTPQHASTERLDCASTLEECRTQARDGKLDRAAAQLNSLQCPTKELEVLRLDLLARVEVQRGRLVSGATAWQQVLALDPASAGAIAGLSALQRGAGQRRGVPWGWVVAALLMVALVVRPSRLDDVDASLRELSARIENLSMIDGSRAPVPAPKQPKPALLVGEAMAAGSASRVSNPLGHLEHHSGALRDASGWFSIFRGGRAVFDSAAQGRICWGCSMRHGGDRRRRRRHTHLKGSEESKLP